MDAVRDIGELYRRQSDGAKELLKLLENPYSAQVRPLLSGISEYTSNVGIAGTIFSLRFPRNFNRLQRPPRHRLLPPSTLQFRGICS